MKFLTSLQIGDRFRVAHPRQLSANGIEMRQDEVYTVDSAFTMSPRYRICTLVKSSDKRIRSLAPGVPVLSAKERAPTQDEVEAFLVAKPKKRVRVVGYELVWSGTPDIRSLLRPQAWLAIEHLRLTGRREFSKKDISDALTGFKVSEAYSAKEIFRWYVRRYVELGLLVPAVEENPRSLQIVKTVVGR